MMSARRLAIRAADFGPSADSAVVACGAISHERKHQETREQWGNNKSSPPFPCGSVRASEALVSS